MKEQQGMEKSLNVQKKRKKKEIKKTLSALAEATVRAKERHARTEEDSGNEGG